MGWNYAELSKMAKETGGPEALVDFLVESGKKAGRIEMIPVVFGGILLGGFVVVVYSEGKKYLKKQKEIYQNRVESAKYKVIQGIKDYNARIPDNGDMENDKCGNAYISDMNNI